VIELILAHIAYDWSQEKIYFQISHLVMKQSNSAFAYF